MRYLVTDRRTGRVVESGDEVTDLGGQVWTFDSVLGFDQFSAPVIYVSLGTRYEQANAMSFYLTVEMV